MGEFIKSKYKEAKQKLFFNLISFTAHMWSGIHALTAPGTEAVDLGVGRDLNSGSRGGVRGPLQVFEGALRSILSLCTNV